MNVTRNTNRLGKAFGAMVRKRSKMREEKDQVRVIQNVLKGIMIEHIFLRESPNPMITFISWDMDQWVHLLWGK